MTTGRVIDAIVPAAVALAGRPAPFILSPPALQKFRTLPPRDRFARSAAMTNFSRRQLGF